MSVRFPTTGFFADNGGEFRNYKMEEFVNKLGVRIVLGAAYLPWLNRVNE